MKHACMRFPLAGVVLVLAASCSSSSSKDDDPNITIPLGMMVDDVVLTAGENSYPPMRFDMPTSIPIKHLTVDLSSSLSAISVVPPAPRFAERNASRPVNATLTIRVGNDEATVCNSGEEYGPFTITVDASENPDSISPGSATATQSTMNIVNQGTFYTCMIIDTPEPAVLSVGSLSADVDGCYDSPLDVEGYWEGTYSCDNQGTAPDCNDVSNELITLRIEQDGHNASYTDFEADFSGTVCGSVFRFNGGVMNDYDEKGTLTFDSNNSASKESEWVGIGYDCRGTCRDTLTRVSIGR